MAKFIELNSSDGILIINTGIIESIIPANRNDFPVTIHFSKLITVPDLDGSYETNILPVRNTYDYFKELILRND